MHECNQLLGVDRTMPCWKKQHRPAPKNQKNAVFFSSRMVTYQSKNNILQTCSRLCEASFSVVTVMLQYLRTDHLAGHAANEYGCSVSPA